MDSYKVLIVIKCKVIWVLVLTQLVIQARLITNVFQLVLYSKPSSQKLAFQKAGCVMSRKKWQMWLSSQYNINTVVKECHQYKMYSALYSNKTLITFSSWQLKGPAPNVLVKS